MGASVWRVGRTAEDRLMYKRSVKAAESGTNKRKTAAPHLIEVMYSQILDTGN